MIQLTEEEAMAYNDCPTLLDLSTGFYIFPVSYPVKYAIM
jgi:sarcosine oxidase/L-pipecolate oxidase